MKKLTLSKEILNNLKKNEYYSQEDFIKDCKCYIKALKSGRLQYTVTHVSNSGMSRNIFIQSYEGTMTKGYFRQYSMLTEILGYKRVNWADIRVSGCGMNMLFATNYDICHDFKRIGLITEKECEILCQKIN